jgi:hypothetical protein
LPPKQTEKIVSNAATFLRTHEVTTAALLKVVKLDLLMPAEVEEITQVITYWRESAGITTTPSRKKGRSDPPRDPPIAQPSFMQGIAAGKHTDTGFISTHQGELHLLCQYKFVI